MMSLRSAVIALSAVALVSCGSEEVGDAVQPDESGNGVTTTDSDVAPSYRFGGFFDGEAIAKERVTATGSGLEYVVIESGNGEGVSPGPADCVTVDYDGRLADTGDKFDSSFDRGQPASFPVGGVISGWTEALQLMVPGDEWILRIPADLGYGENPRPGSVIKPGDDLAFRVVLRDVAAQPSLGEDAWSALPDWDSDDERIQSTESGLKYIVLEPAAEGGAKASVNDRVVVHYEGRFAETGEIFDASWRQCRPAMFGVTQVIKGWTEMLQLMGEGEEVVVYIPSDLAYGRRGKGPIGPDQDLVFFVKLEDVLSVQ